MAHYSRPHLTLCSVRRYAFTTVSLLFGLIAIPSDTVRDASDRPYAQWDRKLGVNSGTILEAYGNLPFSFEPNRGQADGQVRFLSRTPGYVLSLTAEEAIFSLIDAHDGLPETNVGSDAVARARWDRESQPGTPLPRGRGAAQFRVLTVKLLGANPSPAISGRDQLSGRSNYIRGNNADAWVTDVPHYRKVEYRDVYPGIGLVYYGKGRELEYDFVVAPGADYSAIRLGVEGADRITIDGSGNLALVGGDASVRMLKPLVYQEGPHGREVIRGEFVLCSETEICFRVAPYDEERPLVIDPAVVYSYWTGDGTLESRERAIAVDAEGNAYITGSTRYPTYPVVNAFQSLLNGGNNVLQYDAFVTKLNASGTALVYSTYLGGFDDDVASDIAVDGAGCAYVVGATNSTPSNPQSPTVETFPLKGPLPGSYTARLSKVFVTKLSSAGNALVYSTLLGGGKNDGGLVEGGGGVAVSVAVDNAGNAFVEGKADTSGDFPLVGAYRTKGSYFLSKINPSCTALLYSTYLGADVVGSDKITDVSIEGFGIDSFGNAYAAGSAVVDTGFRRYPQLFLQKINSSGSAQVYAKLYGGSNSDWANSLAVDSLGNAYVCGSTWSKDFPVVNAFQASNRDSIDAFVTKFDPTGQVVYATYLGGTSWETATGIAVDRLGDAYVTGLTTSTDFPVLNAFQSTFAGGKEDAFVTCLGPSGNQLLYSTYLGGSDWDWGTAIAVDAYASSYTLGWSRSNDFPTTVTKTASRNMFIVKLGTGIPVKRDTGQVWRELRLVSSGSFKSNPDSNVVTFDGIKAKITRASVDTVSVLLPPELLKNRNRPDLLPDTTTREVSVVASVIRGGGDTLKVYESKCLFVPPRLLIHDEVTRSAPPILQGVLQDRGWAFAETYAFMGYRTDGTAALRITNTSTAFPPPISLLAKVISPPPVTLFDGSEWPSIGNLLNVGNQNAAIQFPIDKDGWYIVVVLGGPLPNPPVTPEVPNSPGPFPAQFQIHLAGNVGLPRKIINDTIEVARGIRLDTYFNHPAPRTETLLNNGLVAGEWAETGLFKFANPLSSSRFPIAVLVPPTVEGFPIGTPPVRAAAPLRMGQLPNGAIDITVPMATTPGAADPVPGTVIDLAQVPIPASVLGPGPPPGIANILGAANSSTVTLPYTATGGTISSLIVDMGSGNEIVDGSGADFRVVALSGTYQAAVSNTPFSETFVSLGSGTAQQDFDLTGSGLFSARYVRLTVATGTASIDAVEALHLFTDQIHPTAGPLADAGWATITMRNRKSPSTALDPFLELIAPDGSALGTNDSGFGDDLDPDRSDAALIKIALTQQGFYRFLGRGYDTRPDAGALGTYSARLETGGEYDPQEITVSGADEAQVAPQKQGTISLPRQRDSYLFQASSGTAIKIVVNGVSSTALADPLVELYDPEDFLIAANDNYAGRGRNSALSVTLPTSGRTFPDPSTYRVVVTGVDTITNTTTSLSNSVCHVREANGGKYELKVFTGTLAGEVPKSPTISSVTPNIAVQGATNLTVTLTGTNYVSGSSVAFSGSGMTVKAISFVTAGQLNATVDIAAMAETGKRNVTVTNPGGLSVTATGIFAIRASLGRIVLQWEAPDPNTALGPPRNLQSAWGSGGTLSMGDGMLKSLASQSSSKAKALAVGMGPAHVIPSTDILAAVVNEVEPNNSIAQAQQLTGDTLIDVNGRAEVRDAGTLTGFYSSDDIEDLYRVTTESPGLSILLDGLTSDCDLYILDPSDTTIVDGVATYGASEPEQIDLPLLPAGTYVIGVSIFDSDPVGPDSTAYALHLRGKFSSGEPTGLTSYAVYRSIMANARQTGVHVGSVSAGTREWTDAVEYVGKFYYQVTAVYSQGESAPSNETSHTITSVSSDGQVPVPASVVLFQNYPNPFNPSTTIRFGLPYRSRVILTVFNTLGQEVARLVNGEMDAGYHEATFDARNHASGVYLYRIQVHSSDSPSVLWDGAQGTAVSRRASPGKAVDYVETRKLCLIR